MTRVAILYATDFSGVSPGGIQEFVKRVGEHAPPQLDITYYGLSSGSNAADGPASNRPPRRSDKFVSVAQTNPGVKNNLVFIRELRKRSEELREYDLVIAHRPEYAIALTKKQTVVQVVHGGTWNAYKTGRFAFGALSAAAEVAAAVKSSAFLSVDPRSTSKIIRSFRTVRGIRTPAAQEFRDVVQSANAVSNPRLVTAARLAPEKRLDRLIDLASLTDRPLTIFGDGEQRQSLANYAAARHVQVSFRGTATRAELASDYAQGGVFCLSSTFEGYPLSAVEALVSGLPVLGVESNAVRQLEQYGAISTKSLLRSAELITAGSLPSPDRERSWHAHDPATVAEDFWRQALRF